jgi:hypothetical protein
VPVTRMRFARFEATEDPSTVLIRGSALAGRLPREWALMHRDGMQIPADLVPEAARLLIAAGWTLGGSDTVLPQARRPRRAAAERKESLPECAACHRPYRLGTVTGLLEKCWHCGQPLTLVQSFEGKVDGRIVVGLRPYGRPAGEEDVPTLGSPDPLPLHDEMLSRYGKALTLAAVAEGRAVAAARKAKAERPPTPVQDMLGEHPDWSVYTIVETLGIRVPEATGTEVADVVTRLVR